ncbi:MAG: acetyl-coenzyme A synthetase N-terminal domain-containing protein, partial [Saprospiraceae bacterium]
MTQRIKTFDDYQAAYQRSVQDPEGFWAAQASTFQWRKPWDKVLEWDFRNLDVKWFIGGKLNITENALDRHLETRGDQIAIIWEPNNPNNPNKTFTYKQLHAEVCKFANVLKARG